jgi:hypothetical protein
MSNESNENNCIDCGETAYYRVVHASNGQPYAAISRTGRGNLCRKHAHDRAAKAFKRWEVRQAAKLAKANASHARWLEAYETARKTDDPFEGLV